MGDERGLIDAELVQGVVDEGAWLCDPRLGSSVLGTGLGGSRQGFREGPGAGGGASISTQSVTTRVSRTLAGLCQLLLAAVLGPPDPRSPSFCGTPSSGPCSPASIANFLHCRTAP